MVQRRRAAPARAGANNNTNFNKERNRLSDENSIVLFRSAQNLCYLMKANMALKGQVYDGLVQGGHSGFDVDPVMEEIYAE